MPNVINCEKHLNSISTATEMQEVSKKNDRLEAIKILTSSIGGAAGLALTIAIQLQSRSRLGCEKAITDLMSLNITLGDYANASLRDAAFINAGLNQTEIKSTISNCATQTYQMIPNAIVLGIGGAVLGYLMAEGIHIVADKVSKAYKIKENEVVAVFAPTQREITKL